MTEVKQPELGNLELNAGFNLNEINSDKKFAFRAYPQVIKYMGSKAQLLPFISSAISKLHVPGKPIVDLFSGACAISGGFGGSEKIISNDIQSYSAVISSCYLKKVSNISSDLILSLAQSYFDKNSSHLSNDLKYPKVVALDEFLKIEAKNQSLIDKSFEFSYHLFTKNYSGTWWSAEQCLWIDSIKQALDVAYKANDITETDYNLGLTCLMHAMAYSSQGTGHYAQYRDAKSESSMHDINKYRQASVPNLFSRKLNALAIWNKSNVVELGHEILCKDYRDVLSDLEPSIVYADPPYAFVHYSRFYHAIETIVKYDYPTLQIKNGKLVKGRYREDRHQSPFCIKTQVRSAFSQLLSGVAKSGSDLILSYSNTGMLGVQDIIDIANLEMVDYTIWFEEIDHDHMTMGRKGDRSREVKEALIMARKNG
ncbi:DNA adenine methylase [Halomonas sp. SIMBA_159]